MPLPPFWAEKLIPERDGKGTCSADKSVRLGGTAQRDCAGSPQLPRANTNCAVLCGRFGYKLGIDPSCSNKHCVCSLSLHPRPLDFLLLFSSVSLTPARMRHICRHRALESKHSQIPPSTRCVPSRQHERSVSCPSKACGCPAQDFVLQLRQVRLCTWRETTAQTGRTRLVRLMAVETTGISEPNWHGPRAESPMASAHLPHGERENEVRPFCDALFGPAPLQACRAQVHHLLHPNVTR